MNFGSVFHEFGNLGASFRGDLFLEADFLQVWELLFLGQFGNDVIVEWDIHCFKQVVSCEQRVGDGDGAGDVM